jgi:nucleoside-diphosphate-sugar epimerase
MLKYREQISLALSWGNMENKMSSAIAQAPDYVVLGAGWLGLGVAEAWVSQGHSVIATTTRSENLGNIEAKGANACVFQLNAEGAPILPSQGWKLLFGNAKVVLVSFPPRLRSGQPPKHYLAQLETLVQALLKYPNTRVLFCSTVGVYPDDGNTWTEIQLPPSNEHPNPLVVAESLVLQHPGAIAMRLGGLFGNGREPARYFAGKEGLLGGNAPVNLLHYDDALDATQTLADHPTPPRVLNILSDIHSTRDEWYTKRCAELGLPFPQFLPEALPGKKVDASLWKQLMSTTS